MSELCRLIWCGLMGFFRSRASLEAEILVLRHQLNILRRKSAKRPTFGSIDRLVIAGLYGFAPNVLGALTIVRPETVIRWHRFLRLFTSISLCRMNTGQRQQRAARETNPE